MDGPGGLEGSGATTDEGCHLHRSQSCRGDPEDGECAVFYFGAGQGGGVNENIQRWIGQFEAPGGGPADKLAKTSKGTSSGLPVTRVNRTGTYKAATGPMMQAVAPSLGIECWGQSLRARRERSSLNSRLQRKRPPRSNRNSKTASIHVALTAGAPPTTHIKKWICCKRSVAVLVGYRDPKPASAVPRATLRRCHHPPNVCGSGRAQCRIGCH
jgi:hypothetical protein